MPSKATVSPSVGQPARPQGANRSSNTMFTGHRIVINDGNFVQTTSTPAENRGFRLLTDAASPSAFHNSSHFSLPESHSNTQATALDRIKGWISDDTAVPVMWLYGAPGTGKSSLAQSIGVWCEQESLLLASFFFSRSDPSRNNIHRFIPTLAYSVIQAIPESRLMIEQAVDSDPHIFSRSPDAQISRLVFRPLSTLAQTVTSNGSRPFPHVLVVDGLDECQDENAQKTVLRLFSPGSSSSNLGWKVLITSRPEPAIQVSFDTIQLSTRLALGEGCSVIGNTPLPNTSNIPVARSGKSCDTPTDNKMENPYECSVEHASMQDTDHFPISKSIYRNWRRKLVLAFDVGITFSGISFSILDPGRVPEVKSVTRFPSNEYISGESMIPSIIYYDRSGKVRAVGAEATTETACELAEEEQWIKSEWFRLHLHNTVGSRDIPPLPLNKSVEEVFADFLEYLFQCAEDYIKKLYDFAFWAGVKDDIDFIISCPNGSREETHSRQDKMRRAAVVAKLIPDTTSGHQRLTLITDGKASLHFSIRNCLPPGGIKIVDGAITIVDASGGTIDVSSYCRVSGGRACFEEIAAPQCHFQGSAFVTLRARAFLNSFLADSPYFDDLDRIVTCFDKTTKLRFRDSKDRQYVKFGSTRDNDQAYNIRFGQLMLQGSDVAMFFEPSIDCIVKAVLDQRKIKPISHVVLLGSFASSDWLYDVVRIRLGTQGLSVTRPNHHIGKTVSDGAISFYLNSGMDSSTRSEGPGTR